MMDEDEDEDKEEEDEDDGDEPRTIGHGVMVNTSPDAVETTVEISHLFDLSMARRDGRAYPTATTTRACPTVTNQGASPTNTNSGDLYPLWLAVIGDSDRAKTSRSGANCARSCGSRTQLGCRC